MAFNWLKAVPGLGRVQGSGNPAADHNSMSESLTETRQNVDALHNDLVYVLPTTYTDNDLAAALAAAPAGAKLVAVKVHGS